MTFRPHEIKSVELLRKYTIRAQDGQKQTMILLQPDLYPQLPTVDIIFWNPLSIDPIQKKYYYAKNLVVVSIIRKMYT